MGQNRRAEGQHDELFRQPTFSIPWKTRKTPPKHPFSTHFLSIFRPKPSAYPTPKPPAPPRLREKPDCSTPTSPKNARNRPKNTPKPPVSAKIPNHSRKFVSIRGSIPLLSTAAQSLKIRPIICEICGPPSRLTPMNQDKPRPQYLRPNSSIASSNLCTSV